jgi:hypothetical protein
MAKTLSIPAGVYCCTFCTKYHITKLSSKKRIEASSKIELNYSEVPYLSRQTMRNVACVTFGEKVFLLKLTKTMDIGSLKALAIRDMVRSGDAEIFAQKGGNITTRKPYLLADGNEYRNPKVAHKAIEHRVGINANDPAFLLEVEKWEERKSGGNKYEPLQKAFEAEMALIPDISTDKPTQEQLEAKIHTLREEIALLRSTVVELNTKKEVRGEVRRDWEALVWAIDKLFNQGKSGDFIHGYLAAQIEKEIEK